MGDKPVRVLCAYINPAKWYIAECHAFIGGDPLTGCERPYVGTVHDIVDGGLVQEWVCTPLDCTDGRTLVWAFGDCQRLTKLFGPYDTMEEAQADNW